MQKYTRGGIEATAGLGSGFDDSEQPPPIRDPILWMWGLAARVYGLGGATRLSYFGIWARLRAWRRGVSAEVWLKKRSLVSIDSGVSLVELLVALGLLALILTILVQVMLPGLRIWKHARALSDIEQQCMVAEDRIARAVMATLGASIQSASGGGVQAISMLGHGGTEAIAGYDTASGNPRWRQVDVFSVRSSDGILYQSFWDKTAGPSLPFTFGGPAFQLTDAQLLLLGAGTGMPMRRLAEKVVRLSLTPAEDEMPPIESEGFVLRLSLTTNVPTGQRTVEREVFLVPRLRERNDEA